MCLVIAVYVLPSPDHNKTAHLSSSKKYSVTNEEAQIREGRRLRQSVLQCLL